MIGLKEVAEAMSSWPSVMVDAVKAGPATSHRAEKEIQAVETKGHIVWHPPGPKTQEDEMVVLART